MRFALLIVLVTTAVVAAGDAKSPPAAAGVESTALRPLILRANAYLSVGQFGDAARTYTEAIGESVPASIVHSLTPATIRTITRRLRPVL